MSSSTDLWYVKLADGDVHRVDLDQLDDAFQAGHIDGKTMVLASGATQWTTLGALLGLDAEEAQVEEQAPESSQVFVPARPLPETGAARAAVHRPVSEPPAPYAPPQPPRLPIVQPVQPPVSKALVAPPQMQFAPAPLLHIPSVSTPLASPAPTVSGSSIRPLSVDLGEFDPDNVKRRGRRGKRLAVAFLALATFGGLAAVAVTRPRWAQPVLGRVGLHSATLVAAAPPPPGTIDAPPPPVATPPSPPEVVTSPASSATPPGDSPLSPKFTDRFTPEQKQKLLDGEKSKSAKTHAKAGNAPAHGGASSKSKSTTFTTGGNKFDPLNSSI